MSERGIRVTVEDLATGDTETKVIRDDWVLICDGRVYLDGLQEWPKSGTVQLTIKRGSRDTTGGTENG